MTVSTLVGGKTNFPIDRVGQAYPGVEISIRDPEENDVGTDVPGTIFVRSDLIADCYLWGDDGQAFRVTPAGATVGDLGELDGNGMIVSSVGIAQEQITSKPRLRRSHR